MDLELGSCPSFGFEQNLSRLQEDWATHSYLNLPGGVVVASLACIHLFCVQRCFLFLLCLVAPLLSTRITGQLGICRSSAGWEDWHWRSAVFFWRGECKLSGGPTLISGLGTVNPRKPLPFAPPIRYPVKSGSRWVYLFEGGSTLVWAVLEPRATRAHLFPVGFPLDHPQCRSALRKSQREREETALMSFTMLQVTP